MSLAMTQTNPYYAALVSPGEVLYHGTTNAADAGDSSLAQTSPAIGLVAHTSLQLYLLLHHAAS